ncbi:MAG: hypothetical protein ACFFDP_13155 [Promethearchaeota archaeon]
MPEIELTDDQRKLMYLIGTYTHIDNQDGKREHWFKDGPLAAAVYDLTVEGVFETYDYAAMSVLCLDGYRRFMNISREGVDDLNDLRELGLLLHLKISTTQYGNVTGYRLSDEGVQMFNKLPKKMQAEVEKRIRCPKCSDQILSIECIRFEEYWFKCPSCDYERKISIFDIEDVNYISKARFLKLPYKNDHR